MFLILRRGTILNDENKPQTISDTSPGAPHPRQPSLVDNARPMQEPPTKRIERSIDEADLSLLRYVGHGEVRPSVNDQYPVFRGWFRDDFGYVSVARSYPELVLLKQNGLPSQNDDISTPGVVQYERDADGLLIDWEDFAQCAQTDPEAFFPDKGGSTREAKRICLRCEVRVECLNFALDNDQSLGIWGGLSERERRRIKKRAV